VRYDKREFDHWKLRRVSESRAHRPSAPRGTTTPILLARHRHIINPKDDFLPRELRGVVVISITLVPGLTTTQPRDHRHNLEFLCLSA